MGFGFVLFYFPLADSPSPPADGCWPSAKERAVRSLIDGASRDLHSGSSSPDLAYMRFHKALSLSSEIRKPALQGEAMEHMVRLLMRSQRPKEALQLIEETLRSIAHSRDAGEPEPEPEPTVEETMLRIYRHSRTLYWASVPLGDVQELHLNIRSLSASCKLGVIERDACDNIGVGSRLMGKLREARGWHEIAAEKSKGMGDVLGYAQAIDNLGVVLRLRGERVEASRLHRKALTKIDEWRSSQSKGGGDEDAQALEARVHAHLGATLSAMGSYKSALQQLDQAIAMATASGDATTLADALTCSGAIDCILGNYTRGYGRHHRALLQAQEAGALLSLGCTYDNLGVLHHSLGDLSAARDNHVRAMRIFHRIGHQPGEGRALSNLGRSMMLDKAQRCDRAKEYCMLALKIAIEMENNQPAMGVAYSSMASIYARAGTLDKAVDFYERALQAAIGARSKGEDEEEEDDDEDEDGGDKPARLAALTQLGVVHLQAGRLKKCIQLSLQALNLAASIGDKPQQVLCDMTLGRAYSSMGDYTLACRHYRKFARALGELKNDLLSDLRFQSVLPIFLEQFAQGMDGWVVALVKQGGDSRENMLAALRVEEWRRCHSELPHLVRIHNSRRTECDGDVSLPEDIREQCQGDVTIEGLATMARGVEAALLVYVKYWDETLMVWVVSGETGELVHHAVSKHKDKGEGEEEEEDKGPRVSSIPELVSRATFLKWNAIRASLSKARDILSRDMTRENVDAVRLEQSLHELFPEKDRGHIPESKWNTLRSPDRLIEALEGSGRDAKFMAQLRDSVLKDAQIALDDLAELIWAPIERECGRRQRTKTVGGAGRGQGIDKDESNGKGDRYKSCVGMGESVGRRCTFCRTQSCLRFRLLRSKSEEEEEAAAAAVVVVHTAVHGLAIGGIGSGSFSSSWAPSRRQRH